MITLPWPPTVNTYYSVVNGRKILSKRGRQYKQDALYSALVLSDQLPLEPMRGDISVFIRAYPPDRRKRDIDNILKPILDVLTDVRVYEDDSQVIDLRIQKFEPTKKSRVEVIVSGPS